LDFGCGKGSYTVPAAGLVGNRGKVYAVDRSSCSLADLTQEASSRALGNVVPVRSIDELKAKLGTKSLNVVLLYDVIHSYYFTGTQRMELLRTLAVMVTHGGIVSVFPRHMSSPEIEGIERELGNLGFRMESQIESELLHDQCYTTGRLYNFRRAATQRCSSSTFKARQVRS
jgi:hypothetical protein